MTRSSHCIDPAVLREYDIRGKVGRQLGEADAHAIGRSFATVVRRGGGRRVVVGYDGRLSSPMLEAALVAGLAASGVEVVRIGLGPSPMLYWAAATLDVDGGIQVTGSHNPRDHNGFKLVHQGGSFFGEQLAGLAALAADGDWEEGTGDVTDAAVIDDYVARLFAGYGGGAFRIGWDCGNGASGPVVERLVKLLPGEHHLLFTEVDGNFPNHHPDPTVEANLADLRALVAEKKLDFGLAFDGDGDRIGAVDGRGRVVWGDQLLAILAEPVLRLAPGAAIIGDVKSSQYLFDRVEELGGRAVMWKTGHSPIKRKMKELDAPLAGEMSGHIFFAEGWYGFDDAHHAAVQLIRALHVTGRDLTAHRDAMPELASTPDIRLKAADGAAIVVAVAERVVASGAAVERVDGLRVTSEDGWWLLRASNTEDAVTVRAEGRDRPALDRLLATVRAELARHDLHFDRRPGK